MSKTIDEKVVQMKFDNSNFERNVAKTLKTLDNLKWKITETDLESSKGLSNLNKAAKDVDMSGLAKGIETVQTRFSALQVIGVTALANLTNSAVNAGKKIVSALGDALVTGGKNRALNIQNAKFQIEGLLGTEEYTKQWARIDESINWAVKDTAYGYDSAAKAASQFMASNVKVGEQMDYSLRAISGVAAMTNSTYDDIANVFTRVAGQGRVMAIDLNSLAARGMNAAAVLGKALNKSEAEIRDMVSDGKISFDTFAKAMDDAFGEHAKKGNETFEGALANMKAAMSRIGAKVWDPLLTNQRDVFNQMRLLLNDLNNNYLDGPINGLNNRLTGVFQNIVKFFELGGMKNILLGIGDILGYIGSVLKPIKEGFRDIFPQKSIESLITYTERFKEWTSQLKLSEETARKLKDTFKGLFSVVRVGVDFLSALIQGVGKLLSALTGVPGGILGITQAIGNWITKLSTSIHESKIFTNVIEGVSNALTKFGNRMKEFFGQFDIFGALVKGFKGIFEFIRQLGSELGLFISTLFKSGNLDMAFKAVNAVFQSGLLATLIRFVNQMKMLTMRSKQFVGNISGTLYALKETLSALQYSIKASAIMEIAKAMLVLAGALLVLSLIDPVRLGSALTATALGMGELIGALYLLGKFNTDIKGSINLWILTNTVENMTQALLVLSVSLKILSTIDWFQMLVSVAGMSAVLWELVGALHAIPAEKDIYKATKSMKIIGTALLIMSVALKIISTIPWPNILWGLGAMITTLTTLTIVMKKIPTYKKDDKIPSMIKMATSLVILAGALKLLSTMGWEDIGKALTAIGGTFTLLWAFVKALPKDLKELNAKINALNMLALGLGFTALALMGLATMSWEQIGVALAAMGGSLAEVLIFLKLLPKDATEKVKGMIGFSSSLVILGVALKILGSLSLPALGIALGAIAGAFIILGIAGKLLTPLAPTLLTIAGAIAVFGVGALAIGGGLMLMAAGISALSVALAGGATIIVAGLTAIIVGIINLIPSIIKALGDGIVIICDALIAAVPKIATTVLTIVVEILKALANDGPLIVKYLAEFLIGVLRELAVYIPDFIDAAFSVIKAFIEGLGKALQGLDPILSLEGVLGLVGLTGLMYMLSGLGSLIGPASIGVLALGALIAELAIVLAAIGALAQIPGLKWLIEEGGNFMQAIGTAIGQLIGGIVGGIALGASAALPGIGQNLSQFMQNIMPFINGAKVIDMSVLGGITALTLAIGMISGANVMYAWTELITIGSSLSDLGTQLSDFMNNVQGFISGASSIDPKVANNITSLAGAILAITAANMLNNISNFMSIFTGGNSLSGFASELGTLGTGLNQLVTNLGTFGDDQIATINCATDALVAISQAASQIPNSGGLAALFAGDNDIGAYAMKLPILGVGMGLFAQSLGNFGEQQVTAIRAAGEAIKAISEVASGIPNSGGLVSLFTGDNDISTFAIKLPLVGYCLAQFASKLGDFGDDQIKAVSAGANAIKELAIAADNIPNSGGLVALFTGDNDISTFAMKLPIVGLGLKSFGDKLNGVNVDALKAGAEAILSLANAATGIPNSGGLVSLFTGDNDISTFAMKLPIVGAGLKSFADKLEGFGNDQINSTTAAVEIIRKMVEITNGMPSTGGLVSLFTGDNDISTFAMKLPLVGLALNSFISTIGDISKDKVELAGNAANVIKELATAASQIPNTGGLKTLFVGDNDISIFAWKLPGVGTYLGQFINNLTDAKFDPSQVDLAKAAAEVLVALASVDVPASGGLKQLFTGENDISTFASKLPGVAGYLSDFINNLAKGNFGKDKLEVVNAAVEGLKALANLGQIDLKTYGGNIEEFGNKLSTFATKLAEFLNNMSGTSAEGVTDSISKVNQIVEMAKTLSSEVISNLNTFTDSLSRIGTDGVQAFVNAFTNNKPKEDVVNAINTMIQSVIDKITGRQVEIETAATNAGNAGVTSLNTVAQGPDIINAGLYFVQGFANGITNNTYLARDAGSQVGKAALNAAKQSIDAHSPSRESFKLGVFFDQGLVNGILKYASNVYNAAQDVGTRAKNGLSSAISKISDIINSDIDTQPTIRPVVDLSGVSSGIGTLNTMLNNSSLAVAANVGAISSNFRGRNQNGNLEVVSAINKLRGDLGNTKGDTYVIDGITYDNGTEVSEAVQTLIRAAKIERRT